MSTTGENHPNLRKTVNVQSGGIWHCLKRERDIYWHKGHVERRENSLEVKSRLNAVTRNLYRTRPPDSDLENPLHFQ